MKRFTTSAQKTLILSKDEIINTLKEGFQDDDTVKFELNSTSHLQTAKMNDGSKLVIAAFDKDDGKTLAIIDSKNLPASRDREAIQSSLRKKLEDLFG